MYFSNEFNSIWKFSGQRISNRKIPSKYNQYIFILYIITFDLIMNLIFIFSNPFIVFFFFLKITPLPFCCRGMLRQLPNQIMQYNRSISLVCCGVFSTEILANWFFCPNTVDIVICAGRFFFFQIFYWLCIDKSYLR